MPLPVDEKYICEMEQSLNFLFPQSYRDAMQMDNGGTVSSDGEDWELYPIFNKADNKCIARTCNHVAKETASAREWAGFPQNAVAIAENGYGDKLIFFPQDPRVYAWRHEIRDIELVADDFSRLESI